LQIAFRLDLDPSCFPTKQEQLGAILAKAADLYQAEELADKLMEVTCLRDELVDWACGGVAMA
jgi:hypothetical protein